jgi:hypothetical protein
MVHLLNNKLEYSQEQQTIIAIQPYSHDAMDTTNIEVFVA